MPVLIGPTEAKLHPIKPPSEMANPESQPGQDDIQEQFVQAAAFPKMKGGAVRGGKDEPKENGRKGHMQLT